MAAVPAPISGLPRFKYGQVIYGAKAYFFEAGTTTPKLTYKDPVYSQEHTHPVVVDGDGNFPAIYVGEGNYDIRIVDSGGAVLSTLSQLKGAVPESEPTDPDAVAPEKLAATGDVKIRYDAGAHTGWVRCNARTIGSATSGASERAHADTEDLFKHLWAKDANLAVSPSRGASAAADWTANKQIALPDGRGNAFIGLDDMGGSAAGRLPDVTFGVGNSTTLGSRAGASSHTLTTAQIPSHSHSASSASAGAHSHGVTGSTNATGNHNHSYTRAQVNTTTYALGGPTNTTSYNGGADSVNTGSDGSHSHSVTGSTDTHGGHAHSVTVESAGGGSSHNNVQPSLLVTFYIKL
jgi:microcystin-dependent protein